MNSTEFNNLTFQEMDKMSVKQLKDIVSKKGQVANKRYDRISSDPYAFKGAIKEAGGRFTVKGMTSKAELIKEAKRIQSFNTSESGTVSGARAMTKSINKAAGVSEKRKKKKKTQKPLSQIKKDIRAKYKKLLKEEGKERAEKYRKRAEAQYKRIQRERKEAREEKKHKRYTADESQDTEPEQDHDGADQKPPEPEPEQDHDGADQKPPEPPTVESGHYVPGVGYVSFEEEQEQFYKEQQEQQEFMPSTNDGDWSSAFI